MSDRVYEILFIADPNLGEPDVDTLATTVQGYVEKEGGRVTKVEKWGKKRLAFLIRKNREGYYVLVVAEGGGDLMKEVERRLKVTEGVIRFLVVRVDLDLKKAERRKAQRVAEEERRRGRQTAKAAAAESEGVSL